MRGKLTTQLMMMTMFATMAQQGMNRQPPKPIKRDKPVILKTCPICKTEHQQHNRFCSNECRIIAKEAKKIRAKKRKNRGR